MNRGWQMLFFVGMMVVVLFAWHGYLWMRLVREPGWPALATRILTVTLVALALSIPAAFILSRALPYSLSMPLALVAFTWMGLSFYFLVTVGAADLLRVAGNGLEALVRWLRSGSGELLLEDPERRQLLARAVGAVALAGAGVAGVGGLRNAMGSVKTKVVEVPLPRLPAALDGFSLVQLTDLHIGNVLGRSFLQAVVERVNGLAPDAVVITGDLVDGSVEHLKALIEPLAGLRSRHGTFFVTGNHEYYSGAPEWEQHLRDMGITVLDNQHVTLAQDSQGRGGLDLAGVPDPTARMLGAQREPDVARAVAGRDVNNPLVLLAHQPKAIDDAVKNGVGLVLSGHTHGGQIWPFGYVVALTQPYLAGLHHHDDTYIYVSRGTGFWGPPLRLGAPAEITRVVLRSA
ncbi:MAG: metallophosphoesterase [Pseudomonadota bacterium]